MENRREQVPYCGGKTFPRNRIPEGACDSHHHIYDPVRFPYVPEIRKALDGDLENIPAYVVKESGNVPLTLYIKPLPAEERAIIKAGCLINYNRAKKAKKA